YTIGSQFCEFNIVVNPQPELICPEDIYLSSNSETLQLNEASPNGGIYSLNGNEISEFNPNDYEDGTYTINYFYEDSETGCQANCSFNIYIYSATEINCPNDLNVCIDDASFLIGGATPPGGNYFINQQEITDFNPALWGVGTHRVSYFYEDAECDFQIIINELPEPICPDDLIVEDTLEVFTLTGGQPEGGWYEINGSEITEFNPRTMSPDTYYITYLYENPETNCIGSCVFSITLNSTVAIESLELVKLQIFPNPNTGNFQVRIYDGFGENSIKVYELNGKLVYENKIQINNDTELLELNLNLASGLYFVKLTNSNNSIIEKLIVE
ncbi:MAG: T9SS type A sorting domain-containing protein, partial [Bacteroidales bacterium]|nr:T9SS type A sorting domain-containing protein [Bacteroidales bacterium]